MSANPNWPRWVRSSVGKHFKAIATSLNFPMMFDGVDEREQATMRASHHFELRVQGPTVREWDEDNYTLRIGVNLMITELMGDSANVYTVLDRAGSLQVSMQEPIALFKLGSGVDDDQSQFGCLTLTSGKDDAVQFYDFGQVGEAERVRQLMLDATYYVDLDTRG